ncbi:MAG: hypothetical protein C5B56_02885 [Proteobacteria bacterium]|nr:MAG: hypothetical protein C5B56_02885 [Pseudomonadota bacterium]
MQQSSLRAERSNPESFRGNRLDCFAALAMTRLRGSHPESAATAAPSETPCSRDLPLPDRDRARFGVSLRR